MVPRVLKRDRRWRLIGLLADLAEGHLSTRRWLRVDHIRHTSKCQCLIYRFVSDFR